MGEYIQMKKFVKKIIVLMLAFAMILSIAPSSVQAATSKKEKENNNTEEKANKLSTSYARVGSLSGVEDVDWFVYTVEKSGITDITFKVEGKLKADQGFDIYLYDGLDIVDYRSINSNDKIVSCKNLSYPKGTKIYVSIMTMEYGAIPKGVTYSIRVKNTKKTNWETENNNSKEKADVLKTKKSGVVYCNQYFCEEDWYVFTATSMVQDITLFTDKRDKWYTIHVYSSKGKEIASDEMVYDEIRTISVNTSIGEQYYVKISRSHISEFGDIQYPYTLKLIQGEKANIKVQPVKEVTLSGIIKEQKQAGYSEYVLRLDEKIVIYNGAFYHTDEVSEILLFGDEQILKENSGKHVSVQGTLAGGSPKNDVCEFFLSGGLTITIN